MRNPWKMSLALALFGSTAAWAAGVAASSPAPATGAQQSFVCKDGSTVSAATSQGACRGHQGIDTEATAKAQAGAAGKSGSKTADKNAKGAAAPATAAASAASTKEGKATPAPGGGPGKVWANASSKIYHCHGDRHYGTTKAGSYMTEAEAKAQGMQPSRNKACS